MSENDREHPPTAVTRAIVKERKERISGHVHELKPGAAQPGHKGAWWETWCGEAHWDGADTSSVVLAEGEERPVSCPDCIKAKAEAWKEARRE